MTIQDLLGAVRDRAIRSCRRTASGWRSCGRRPTSRAARVTPTSGSCAADGSSPPRLLIGGDKTENTPRWAPDGKRLAFMSNRDGDTQHLRRGCGRRQRPRGDEDRRRRAAADGVLARRHDGRVRRRREAGHRTPAGQVHRVTRLLYRHWDEWRENVRHHVFVVPVAGGEPRDLTPGDFDSPPGQQEDAAIAFTPDGHEVVFVSNRDGNRQGSVVDQQRRLVGACRRRTGEEADTEPGRRRAAASSRRTASS